MLEGEDDIERHVPPEHCWKVQLNHVFPEKPKASILPRWSQVPKLIGMAYRFLKYARATRKKGRQPFIDPYAVVPCRQCYGVPIGGIGAGTIGRGWKGDFNRWQLTPGIYKYNRVDANQFTVCIRKNDETVYQQVLLPSSPQTKTYGDKSLQSWKWNFNGGDATYYALYPRAWTVYNIPEHRLRLTCRQVSPIFPNNYKDTSLPVGLFIWTIENFSEDELEVSIMFSFQNGDGSVEDLSGGHYNESFSCKGVYSEIKLEDPDYIKGEDLAKNVILDNEKLNIINRNHINGVKKKDKCEHRLIHDVSGVVLHHSKKRHGYTIAIAARQISENEEELISVSSKVAFDPATPCKGIWEDLSNDGALSDSPGDPHHKSLPGQCLAAAVCAKTIAKPFEKKNIEFALAWDSPMVEFGSESGIKYCRRYTRFFGEKGNAAPSICCYALQNYKQWEEEIEKWQKPILDDKSTPDWYKSALFNELYFISDGGTIWLDIRKDKDLHSNRVPDVVKEYGRFAYLEGHEYRMYNTYDVHFYASWALVMLWPKLQLSLQYDVGNVVLKSDEEDRLMMMEGHRAQRKVPGCVPHDIGDPEDEPFFKVNAYSIHDTACWKDLNLKFVLQVYRDFYLTKDKQFLADMWPSMKAVMVTAMGQDSDDDGLIDNSGFADQTFDCWIVSGASAYCGGLWLAALRSMYEIANILELNDSAAKYNEMLNRGRESYERKLWNGKYYNYDCSESGYHDSIMADQCAGQWYLHATDLGQQQNDRVFPSDHIRSALQTVFQMNVMQFQGGFMGAVNGMRPNGRVDTSSVQSEEVWTGVSYAVASSMIQEGLVKEGFRTAEGVYRTCYEKLGLGFQTPEAYLGNGNFRSLGYMRPLSIWSIQWTLEQKSKRENNLTKDKATADFAQCYL